MQIGFALPQFGGQARTGGAVARFARELEAAGAHSLWVDDRLLDPLVLLAVAAGVTERVRLGTNVLVAPLYPPAMLAQQLTTVDVLSAGRLTAGFGIGSLPEAYRVAGVPFHERDVRLEETLDALEAIWSVQTPRPPIHLAGATPQSLARIGRRADGWLPVLPVPTPLEQYGHLLQQRETVVRAAEAADRDPNAIETTIRINATAGTPLQDIAEAVHQLSDRTLFDTVLMDLHDATDSTDHALDATLHLLELLS